MGIVKDIQVGSSSHFFILPEEELSVLYPEIKDFTGYVNLHVEQDCTNLLARQQEFGVFQSVGMSEGQLSRMLSYECLYYIGITLLVSLTVGTLCSMAVCSIFDQIGIFGKISYHFPLIQLMVFAAAMLLVQAIFSICAVRYTRKFSLVERIKAMD